MRERICDIIGHTPDEGSNFCSFCDKYLPVTRLVKAIETASITIKEFKKALANRGEDKLE